MVGQVSLEELAVGEMSGNRYCHHQNCVVYARHMAYVVALTLTKHENKHMHDLARFWEQSTGQIQ